ncbi:MAG: Smr/MutS family protein [Clostridiales Family XIII bacterium]|jgi:DNA mismatch repair protein MutS2|nr:Smr/MutS family protein [Clostridiales Family XIII bacterium]
MLAERTVSGLAARIAQSLEPARDAHEITKGQTETAEAVSVCLRKGTPPFSDLPDLGLVLAQAAKGGCLTMKNLLSVQVALSSARRVRAFLSSDMPEDAALIRKRAMALAPQQDLEERIARSILSDTEMADSASQTLAHIRRGIEAQHAKIRTSLAKYITGTTYDNVLMDKVVTMRNGRFVVPVKQEQAGRFPGIVHDRSNSGQAVFIEPEAVVNLNNKLRELALEEEAEIERILYELSGHVGAVREDILYNQDLLVGLDFAFAKANLALDMKATAPELTGSAGGAADVLEIVQGRNPLIDAAKVVPTSLAFGGKNRILVVTGPNTGGKTVTLKTVGLFILMAASGLQVPAARARLPVAERVFADIGDEQSIEQSLSTFSSHMKNIVEICREAGPGSVVLLDELGAGTDPAEGAALAVAVLETLLAQGSLVMATTHYTELKKFAVATDGVENASMEFDVATLSPTYRLMMGNPGRSNAFEIAEHLGLGSEVVQRARDLLAGEAVTFDNVMAEIEQDRTEAARARAEAEWRRAESDAAALRLEHETAEAERKAQEIIAKAKEKAKEITEDAGIEAQEAMEELKGLIREARTRGVAEGVAGDRAKAAQGPADAGDLLQRADGAKKRLRKTKAGTNGSSAMDSPPPVKPAGFGPANDGGRNMDSPVKPANDGLLAPGDIVRISGMDSEGEVLEGPDASGKVRVLIGTVRMTIPTENLARVDISGARAGVRAAAKNRGRSDSRYAKIVVRKMGACSPSIDLHGMPLDEAERLVEKYLDDAILARMHEVMICHGRGEGILREGIRRMLKKNKHAAKFRAGDFDEGGDGVTIVTLSNK